MQTEAVPMADTFFASYRRNRELINLVGTGCRMIRHLLAIKPRLVREKNAAGDGEERNFVQSS
jgi:hypothetical protein